MHIRVNKNTSRTAPVKYAALSSGTISHVWGEEETVVTKRTNRIKLTREVTQKVAAKNYDA